MAKLLVDKRRIEVDEGTTLLQACLYNNIYIPNLCYLEGMHNPPASCRICFVEIEGEKWPVTSCTVTVKDEMVVKTDTASVRRLQRTGLQLLLSVHHVDCGRCPANKKCELQRVAKFLRVGLRPKHLERRLKEPEVERYHPILDYYPNRCVLCGKCVYVCKTRHGHPFMAFAKRGLDTTISLYGEDDLSRLPCERCTACVEICPVGAIVLKKSGNQTSRA
jgi:NADH dehydrogenase/NADH:ubiquinone oxidoreductase subunit G